MHQHRSHEAALTNQVVERCQQRRGDVVGGDQGGDLLPAVISWCCAPVPQRPGVTQTQVLMDPNQRADGLWRQGPALTRLLQDTLLLFLRSGA